MEKKKVLILAKTYPSPSTKYIETSCVAGIEASGRMIRLYPVPFRMMERSQQFSKWQWIEVLTGPAANGDNRPESHRIGLSADSPQMLSVLKPEQWGERARHLASVPTFDSFAAVKAASETQGISLALLKPKQILELLIEKEKNPQWTREEMDKLSQEAGQPDLFSDPKKLADVPMLRKMPYRFYYRYLCSEEGQDIEYRHKITDWEAGALYWNCRKSPDWEQKFRAKYGQEFIHEREVWFLMGNMRRFPSQWLIISVIYPPKQTPEQAATLSLF